LLNKYFIPEELKHPFFSYPTVINAENGVFDFPFINELLFYHGFNSNEPWKEMDLAFKGIKEEWEKEKERIQLLHQNRVKFKQNEMKKSLELYFKLLFWSNSVPVDLAHWQKKAKDFSVCPVNMTERLSFILQRPTLFSSFAQLVELFQESHKQYIKNQLIQSRKRDLLGK
jgi:hypothetical protein